MTAARVGPTWALPLMIAVVVGWGVNWPLMKIALMEMPPLHFRTLCLGIGAAGVFVVAWLTGAKLRVPAGAWPKLILLACLNFLIWNLASAYGLRWLDSGRAAILAYTMPLWSVLFGVWILKERMTGRRVVGLLLGLAGMLALLGGEITSAGRSPLGAMLMIVAAVSWAIGIVVMKRWPVDLPPASLTAWQMAIAAAPIAVGALLLEEGSFAPWSLSPRAAWAATYTLVVSYLFCQWAWIKLALVLPVAISSLSTLAIPVIGVFAGILVLGERPAVSDYLALALVSLALAVVLIQPRRR